MTLIALHCTLKPIAKCGGCQQVRSRFAGDGFDPFIAALKACGFQHHTTDSSNKMFVVFEFTKKGQRQPEDAVWPELKPCLYKHR